MKYAKGSIEYEMNCASLREMLEAIPMTLSEQSRLQWWVREGHDINSNPWKCFEPDGSSMNYLKAFRILFGAPHGPWDSWEYETYLILDRSKKHLLSK